jgi:hypothetical protein
VIVHVLYLVAIAIVGWLLSVRTFVRRLNK